MSTRRDLAGPLQLAGVHALIAHRALGRMAVSSTVAEFSDASVELVTAARGMWGAVATLARSMALGERSERRRAFMAWFGNAVVGVLQHPLQRWVVQATASTRPVVYVSRVARGSCALSMRDGDVSVAGEAAPGVVIARMAIVSHRRRAEDFYFKSANTRPAIVMCAEYLERVTTLLDASKVTLHRLGLE